MKYSLLLTTLLQTQIMLPSEKKVSECRCDQQNWTVQPKPSIVTNHKWKLGSASSWSDLIHITLWRNDGFLHSFHNFLKSNAFGENLIRTKFILHKIFFQVSILSSNKILWMLFNLHSKMTLLVFQFIIITHDKLMTVFTISAQFFMIFSDFVERNKDYSSIFDFRRKWVGEITFFILESLITKLYFIFIYIYLCIKDGRYRSQFRINFHEIHMVGAGLSMDKPYCFWKQSVQYNTEIGENVPPYMFFSFHAADMGFFMEKTLKQYSVPHFPQKKL